MRSRTPFLFLLVTVGIIFIFSITGVWATWTYSISPTQGITGQIGVGMSEFKWEGSEVLPDDVKGENHLALLEKIVYDENIGLNNPNSQLNGYIDDRIDSVYNRDYFGSMAVTGGGEIEQLFGTEAADLCFIVRVISDTEYHVFTTFEDLGTQGSSFLGSNTKAGSPNIAIGEWIYPVYRTILKRENANSDWVTELTQCGMAKSAWYLENKFDWRDPSPTQIPSFNPTTWQEGDLGKEMTTTGAIPTFIGNTATAHVENATVPTYYKLTSKANATRKVTTYNLASTIRVYNSSSTLIATSSVATDSSGAEIRSVSWSATNGATYYIEVAGSKSITFTVA